MYLSLFDCRHLEQVLFSVRKLHVMEEQPSKMADGQTNFTFINVIASIDNVQNMGTKVPSTNATLEGLAPPLCLELHVEATCRRWTFGSTKVGSVDTLMRPSQTLANQQDPPNTVPSKCHPWITSVFPLNGGRWSHMDPWTNISIIRGDKGVPPLHTHTRDREGPQAREVAPPISGGSPDPLIVATRAHIHSTDLGCLLED